MKEIHKLNHSPLWYQPKHPVPFLDPLFLALPSCHLHLSSSLIFFSFCSFFISSHLHPCRLPAKTTKSPFTSFSTLFIIPNRFFYLQTLNRCSASFFSDTRLVFPALSLFTLIPMESKLHHALTVSNIKSHIPITLEKDSTHYTTWKTLFQVHCQAYEVIDHLSPKPATASPTAASDPAAAAQAEAAALAAETLWKRLDAIVLQWIYATISSPLLHIILQPGQTAHDAWLAVEREFNDNKNTRAIFLGQEFANLCLENFSSMADYCQHAKHLAEQLASVGSPVDNRMLVIKILTGLTDQYDGISTVLQNRDPLPDFNEVRSRLNMEEQKKKRQVTRASQTAATALATTTSTPSSDTSQQPTSYSSSDRGRGRTRGGRGRGRGRSSYGRGNNRYPNQQPNPSHPYIVFPSNWTASQWANLLNKNNPAQPPCPYPSKPNNQSQGILGPRPDQAHYTGYSPTDIEQALYSLALNQPDHGFMDTGASSHSANEQGIYSPSNFNTCTNKNIVVGNGMTIPVLAQGNQVLPPPYPPLKLNNVLFAPNIIKNLISVRRLTTDNLVSVEFDPFGFLVKDLKTQAPILRCNSTGDLYPLTAPLPLKPTQSSAFAAVSQDRWHQRLGHPGNNLLQSLKLSSFVDFGKSSKTLCQPCIFGKSVKLPFYDSINCTRSAFDIVHSDLWTSPVLSTGGHKYYILFLDDFTNFLWTFPIATKSQVFHTFATFHNLIHTQFERKIKQFQCDNGKEYANHNFYNFCNHNGMQFRFSCPHTSPQNGKAERKIRTINNMIRTLLAQASLPPNMWHHALETATYLLNILPSKLHHFQSPTTLLYKCTPEYEHLRVFGCLCFPLTPSTTIHKLNYRSHPCVFLGYPSNHRGYKCLDLTSHQIIISRHVHFEESIFPYTIQSPTKPSSYDFLNPTIHPLVWEYLQKSQTTNPPPTVTGPIPTTHTPLNSQAQFPGPQSNATAPQPQQSQAHPSALPPNPAQTPSSLAQTVPTSTTQTASSTPTISQTGPTPTVPTPSPPVPPPPPTTRTIHTRSMSGIVKPKQLFNLHTSTVVPIPKSPQVALSTPEWYNAMSNEFSALIKNKTWELVPRTPDMNIIRSLWLFKHKFRSDGSLERYKARLVCDGRKQQTGIDCGETFSPVVKPSTIRLVLSLALSKSWSIHQLDVTNAFLHGNLDETVYMHQPMGFRHRDFPDHVCRLRKSLYGLKQAPRAWYQRFTDFVTLQGFRQSKSDNSLFIYHHGSDIAYLLIYVDDIILTTSTAALRNRLLHTLSGEFAMKDLGPLSYFLGIQVTRDGDNMFLSQQAYVKDIIHRASMDSCKPVATPVDTQTKLSANSGPLHDDPSTYRSLAGALQYLTFTRPDISYAVQQVCMHMHAPRLDHWNALKRIIRYLQGTADFGLHLGPVPTLSLVAYTDADWAGCPDTRRSTSGYAVYLGENLISWSSKRQSTISRSSAEAEYRGVANVVADICWLRNLLLELHHPLSRATLVYCDNVSAVYLSGNPVQHQRTKHIELDIHFVREQVHRGHIRVLHVPSRHQIADIFTKGLPRVLFDDFRTSLNIGPPDASTAGV